MTPSRPGRNPRGRAGQSRDFIAALHAAGGKLQRLALLAGATLGNHPAHNEVLLEIAKVLQKARDDRRALRAVSSRRSTVTGTQDAMREPDRPELLVGCRRAPRRDRLPNRSMTGLKPART
jgi:hypothetical protein